MRSLLLMIVFFTRIPIKYKYEYREEDLKRGIKLFPLIGTLIGAFIFLPSLLDKYLDKPIIIVFSWMMYIWITGGLHIDGLADTFDGVFSNRDKKRVLEIMKDSRIGTFGVIGIIFILISNIALSNYIDYKILFLLPILGRTSSIISASVSNYARKELGMGTTFINNSGIKEVLISLLYTMIISYILLGYRILIGEIITFVTVLAITKYIKDKIDGMTGDTIGFVIEISQTVFLFVSYLTFKLL
ncbi:adenosylcobinamide-GDP ribazoletransferase [Dethiothermospora halolimnae]|uniref:adenosylcobinamide-GDP ribazoletransferase n=1 Tax=Dethiothermospora halolimnae TaxID=3114390 RepID=UPI003CCBFAAF